MNSKPLPSDDPLKCQYSFFCHSACEFFPCHDTQKPEEFNCLFCYCPLYALGERCGGNFTYTKNGVKDCKGCMLPHRRESFPYIMSRFREIVELIQKSE